MQTFLFQTGVQLAVIAAIWVLVARDATKLRERHGTTPSGLSPFAWGALCGLTWIALIPYFTRRGRVTESAPPTREKNLTLWWVGLAVLAIVWSAFNASQDDFNNAGQHGLLAAIFAVCAFIAWSRDRSVETSPAKPNVQTPVATDER